MEPAVFAISPNTSATTWPDPDAIPPDHSLSCSQYNCINGTPSLDEYEYDYDYLYEVIQKMVYPQVYEWFLIAAYAIVLVAALAGNTLVCFAVLKNEHMRTVTNYYIVNLGFADILVSLLCLPITVVVDVSETWFFGQMACRFIPYFQVSSYEIDYETFDLKLSLLHAGVSSAGEMSKFSIPAPPPKK